MKETLETRDHHMMILIAKDLQAMYCKYCFFDILVIEPSRDRFAIDWFEMSGRRDAVENFKTSGVLQITQQTASLWILFSTFAIHTRHYR